MPVLSSIPMLADVAETLRLLFIAIGLAGIAALLETRLYGLKRPPAWVGYGVAYGCIGLAAMQFPIVGLFDLPVDLRGPVLAMAVLMGGPKALLLAGAILLPYRWGVGGSFVVIGLLTIASTMVVALGFWAIRLRRHGFGWTAVGLLGVAVAVANAAMAATPEAPLNPVVVGYLILLVPIYPAALLLLAFAASEVRLHRDLVEGRRAMEERLSRALAQAEASSRARSRLLASASHDLRTPLNAIQGYTGAMQAGIWGPIEPARYGEYLDDIARASDQLLHLIDRWIEVARDTGEDWTPKPVPVGLPDLLDDVAITLRPAAAAKSVALTMTAEGAVGPVLLDRGAARQILANLAGNGVKYTPRGGSVTVAAVWAEDRLTVTVSDTGPGLPKALTDVAHMPFVRGEHSPDVSGWGLGLAIVDEIVRKLGGTLTLDDAPGGGALATATLPAPPRRPRSDDGPGPGAPGKPSRRHGKRPWRVGRRGLTFARDGRALRS